MPHLDFTLPHWAYWLGLIVFPIVAAFLARRQRTGPRTYSVALGYMIWLTGGMMGLHRFYLKSLLGLFYIPVFVFILYANGQATDARSAVSDAANIVRSAEKTIERETGRLETAEAELAKLRAAVEATEEGSLSRRSAERKLKRAEARFERAERLVAEARADLEAHRPALLEATERQAFWERLARGGFYLILAALAIDAVLLPILVRRANATIREEPVSEAEMAIRKLEEEEIREDSAHVSTGWTGLIDRLTLVSGEFVAYWAVIAVIVYYFEVISRYVFGSPTNWAHESMYLMFGMQYLIAGSYAMLTESHVRVDIFYANMSRRGKALVDVLTSVFFFIFAGTLLVTSYIFAFDAIAVPSGNSVVSMWARGEMGFWEMLGAISLSEWTDPNIRWGEISFNEWEIPLWPMKWVMVVGALLLILQGISKLAQDLRIVVKGA
ncbi:MAG: TRAP transporter small permease subunit [Alphaproteobacteria bacterium]|nr:MAG: TRAP transporter small permease subunit [Alphaproteobacteria bacterium]